MFCDLTPDFVVSRLLVTLISFVGINPIYKNLYPLFAEGFTISLSTVKQWFQTASVTERKKNINELEQLSGTLFLILFINFGRH